MRKTLWIVAALMVALPACGGDESTGGGQTTGVVEAPGVTFDTTACPDPIEVSTVAGLIDVLAAVTWDWVGPYSSGSTPPSADLLVVGEITIDGAQVPLPEDCLGREDCRHTAVFSASREGAVVAGGDNWFEGESSLTLADTTVRVSAAMMDTHPGPYNFIPLITVIGPCGEACAVGQLACQADLSCYGDFDTFCRRCQNGSAEECACRDVEGPLPDGTTCDYWVSGDVIEVGTCRSGRCQP
ncbi:MAG: hypothetical protein KJ956_09465 [Actinobacteria bacterium]|nr:hypothetical protein [Actinomycetota bacterium]